jgi:phosphoribosylaminoimidazole-succinocarboxamide synthase
MSAYLERNASSAGVDVEAIVARGCFLEGRSKKLYRIDETTCLVELIPSLSSFTYQRHEIVPETDVLRLDFYERVAAIFRWKGILTAFCGRVGPTMYVARWLPGPPFETIVKNFAVGSTTRKYPGLYPEGAALNPPVVKFDYRIDPEDQPIADDYVRNY